MIGWRTIWEGLSPGRGEEWDLGRKGGESLTFPLQTQGGRRAPWQLQSLPLEVDISTGPHFKIKVAALTAPPMTRLPSPRTRRHSVQQIHTQWQGSLQPSRSPWAPLCLHQSE